LEEIWKKKRNKIMSASRERGEKEMLAKKEEEETTEREWFEKANQMPTKVRRYNTSLLRVKQQRPTHPNTQIITSDSTHKRPSVNMRGITQL
jgi:hypothetical protein